jgi:FkbM family methyltransferase
MLKQSIRSVKNRASELFKSALYRTRGEPYDILGTRLRFPPGKRPIRMKYLHSDQRLAREEAMALALLLSQLGEGDTAIDVGAHIGIYSTLMASRCGRGGRVVAFEPDPAARAIFGSVFKLNPELTLPKLEGFACSDNHGSTKFFSSRGDSRSSLVHGNPEAAEEIEVATIRLDDYLDMHALQPTFVKIDVEGAEIHVLRGAERLLRGSSTIVCEMHPFAWPRFGVQFQELTDIVGRAGRRVRYLSDTAHSPKHAVYGLAVLEKRG